MRIWLSIMVAAGMATAAPALADTGYLKITGKKAGVIPGEVTTKGKEKQHEVIDFRYGVETPGTVMATGRRVQQPVMFTLRWSAGTPTLFNAAYTNETLTQVQFMRWTPQTGMASGAGAMANADDILLTNARITSIRIVDRNGDTDNLEPLVEVTLAYQKLEITHKEGGITAIDDWPAN